MIYLYSVTVKKYIKADLHGMIFVNDHYIPSAYDITMT